MIKYALNAKDIYVAILKLWILYYNQLETYISFGYSSCKIKFQEWSSEKDRLWTKKEAISIL